ncbi:MAG: ribonuclease P protein component [Xanthomonadaceae bacterium]|nr:ribonuclease P protein component [Xanthomonadaceae bacterium]
MTETTFPRLARLLSGAEFKRVFGHRKVNGNRLFRVHSAPLAEVDGHGARLGLAISKRNARRAVDRNRIRRQVRESFRLRRPKLNARDYVVTANSEAASASDKELRQALNQLWLRFEIQ